MLTASFRRLTALAIGAAGIALAPSAASATNYVIDHAWMDTSINFQAGFIQYNGAGTYNEAGTSIAEGAYIGRIALEGYADTDVGHTDRVYLPTWCVDIFGGLVTNATDTFRETAMASMNYGDARVTALTNFMTHTNSLVTDADSNAAVQLGIWEILNEDSNTAYNVTSGAFRVSDLGGYASISGAASIANGWLGNLTSATAGVDPVWKSKVANFDLVMLAPSPTNQQQAFLRYVAPPPDSGTVTAPVPEPASWMTMILGFGAVGTAVRRRRAMARATA